MKEEIAFICDTPYHIFNAINVKITEYPSAAADVFIYSFAKDYLKIADNLRATGLFRNVFTIECDMNDGKHGLELAFLMVKRYTNLKMQYRKYLCNKKYNFIFICSPLYMSNSILLNYTKWFVYMEDGIASYITPITNLDIKTMLFYRLLGIQNFEKRITEYRFYAPKLVQTQLSNLRGLPIPGYTQPTIDTINSVFGYDSSIQSSNTGTFRYFFLEEIFDNPQAIHNSTELFSHIISLLKKSDCVLKKHPRSKENAGKVLEIDIMTSYAPWEVFCMNMDMEKIVLITISTTAVLSPKIIFDKEPIVVCLYELLGVALPYHNDKLKRHFDNVKNLYTNSRFFIPKTLEELDQFFYKLTGSDANT